MGNIEETRFVSVITAEKQERGVRLMVESLRAFGGDLGVAPVWLFYWDGYRADPTEAGASFEGVYGIQPMPLALEEGLKNYYFAAKVCACAQAEELATPQVKQIVWFAADCLLVKPPELFKLGSSYDAAFRTVHHRNIGLLVTEPLDAFWKTIYSALGLEDTSQAMESYVDGEKIRPYFNSHIFALDPAWGLMRRWKEVFSTLVADRAYQEECCSDQLHQIFLHQAILSALLTADLEWERIRLLPPEYSYPLHFHQRVPKSVRPKVLNDLVCIAYEDMDLHPDVLQGIQVHEPLRSWLAAHLPDQQ